MNQIEANGLTFSYREQGEGEPVMLLHGFPETSFMWTRLMRDLASAGYRCIAPDQRGYSPGARPQDVEEYRYGNLASDIFSIAKAVGFDRFHLIGHDWGALTGWCALAMDERPIQSWTAMSVPHARAFAEAVRDDPAEEAYRGFLNSIGEATAAVFTANDGTILRTVWSESSPEEKDEYMSVLGDTNAMAAALNYYRAARGHMRSLDDPSFEFGPVSTPTLLLWGRNELYVCRMSVDLAEQYMIGPYRVEELDAAHWLIQERYDEVRDHVLAHLRENAI